MRRTAVLVTVAVLLLIPVVVVAQDTVADVVELIFTDGGAEVGITDTIASVAVVSVEIDGQQYMIKVPVTIDIDATVPLTSSILTVPASARVGALGVEILELREFTEETEIVMPGYWGGGEKEYSPTGEDNKLVVIDFNTTNAGSEQMSLGSYACQGVDETGRLFEEVDFSCEEVNPGGSGRCATVFDVPSDVNIVALDIEVTDHRQIAIPR